MNLLKSLSHRLIVALIISLALCTGIYAADMDGTWRLVSRKLPDGTLLSPPTVQGMSSTKNGMNQLIVFWPAPDGSSASLSSISKWEWSETEVAATPMLVIFDDGSGKPPVYAVGGETKRMPVTRHGGQMSYQHPIDPPFIVWDGNKMTATIEGVFVDYWERVR